MPSTPRTLRPSSLVALGLALLPFIAGCPPPYPKCKSDDNCASHGEVCVDGLCKECKTDLQCKQGYTCSDGACVQKKVHAPGTCDTDSDCPGGEPCQNHRCVTPPPAEAADAGTGEGMGNEPTASCQHLTEVHFDFNEFGLTEQSRSALEHDADCIRQAARSVTIEGNCDERGTEEYNLVLGEKRADSVRRYLVGLGVNESALKTVSYGKLRPKDPGHTEAAWAANRRADLVWR